MEEIVPLKTSPTETPLIGVPGGSLGKKIWAIGYDKTGVEITFEDQTKLVVEDFGASLGDWMEVYLDDGEAFRFTGKWFLGIWQEVHDEDLIILHVKTNGGTFDVDVNNRLGLFDIRVTEVSDGQPRVH